MKNRQRALAIVARIATYGPRTWHEAKRFKQWNRAATARMNAKYAAEALENNDDR